VVSAIDPMTRGALKARLSIVGSTVHLRSFLEPATKPGLTIKGSGSVAFKANRKNCKAGPMTWNLTRALDNYIRSIGADPANYNYGLAQIMQVNAKVSLNGRR
jgi:hypothetical protein